MKIVFAVLASLMISGSVLAGSIPATDADRSDSARSTRERRTDSASPQGVRVSVAGLNGPLSDVMRETIAGVLSEAGYEVIDLYPEQDLNSSGSYGYAGGSDQFIFDMVSGAMGTDTTSTQQSQRRVVSKQKSAKVKKADYIISGSFDTQGLVRKSVATGFGTGQQISLEGLIALKIRQSRTNRILSPSKPIRESYSQWVGVGGNSDFIVVSGRSSDFKYYVEVYERIAEKILVAMDEAVERSSSSTPNRIRRR